MKRCTLVMGGVGGVGGLVKSGDPRPLQQRCNRGLTDLQSPSITNPPIPPIPPTVEKKRFPIV